MIDFMKKLEGYSKKMESKSKYLLSDFQRDVEVSRLTSDLRRAAKKEVALVDAAIESLAIQVEMRKDPFLLDKYNEAMASLSGRSTAGSMHFANTNFLVSFSSDDASLKSRGDMAIREYQKKLEDAFCRLDSAVAGDSWKIDLCERFMKMHDVSGIVWARYCNRRKGMNWLASPQ